LTKYRSLGSSAGAPCICLVDLLKVTNKSLEFLKKNFYIIFFGKLLLNCTLRQTQACG